MMAKRKRRVGKDDKVMRIAFLPLGRSVVNFFFTCRNVTQENPRIVGPQILISNHYNFGIKVKIIRSWSMSFFWLTGFNYSGWPQCFISNQKSGPSHPYLDLVSLTFGLI